MDLIRVRCIDIDKMKEKTINFFKYSALGNDYIVIDPNSDSFEPDAKLIENICSRNFGIGADGILLGPIFNEPNNKVLRKSLIIPLSKSLKKFLVMTFEKLSNKFLTRPLNKIKIEGKTISVRIFNSDGSEAEKSGNGLRIFSQYLMDKGYIKKEKSVEIITKGGVVKSTFNDDRTISIEMGKIKFYEDELEILAYNEMDEKNKVKFKGTYLSIGNPHFVIIMDKIDESLAKKYGKSIETNSFFKNKTNVQFAQILSPNSIKIEIYERGSGYTLASGSSACAAAATCFKKGLVEEEVEVVMQGGRLKVFIGEDFNIVQRGKVKYIFQGKFFISTFLDKFQN